MSRVLEIHKQGYNCAESILEAINEQENLNLPVSMASFFGGGMGVGSACGAITGALMALGAVKGRENPEGKNLARISAREFMNKLYEKYETYNCIELKKKGITCDAIIEDVYQLVNEYIK